MEKVTILQSSDIFTKALEVEDMSVETIKAYTTDIKVFYTFIREELNNRVRYVEDIKFHHLQQYKTYLRNRYTMRTSARKYNCIRTYIRKMYENGFIFESLHIALRSDKFGNQRRDKNMAIANIIKQVLPEETLPLILQRIEADKGKNKYRDLCIFHLLFIGQRRGDILNIKWSQFNFSKKTLMLWREKTKTFDTVELKDETIEAFKTHFQVCQFTNTLTDKVFNLSTTPYNKLIEKYTYGLLTETGDPNITGHTFRHTFVTICVRKNVPLSAIQQFTGQSLETIQQYTHLSVRDSSIVNNAISSVW